MNIDGFDRPVDSLVSGSKPRDGFVAQRYINNEPASETASAMPAQVTYDVLVHGDTSDFIIPKVSPSNARPDVEILPAPVGAPVTIFHKGQIMYFQIIEQPKFEDCENQTATGGESLLSRALRLLGI